MRLFRVIIKKRKADNTELIKRIKSCIYLSVLILAIFCSFRIAHANIQVAAGMSHTLGLKSDGTVLAVGYNSDGQCNVSSWTDIIKENWEAQTSKFLRKDEHCCNNSCSSFVYATL